MALTESYMLPLGTQAPFFKLPNVVLGIEQSLDELKGAHGTLVVFMCNHCPYVIHLLEGIIQTAGEFSKKGINTIAISSNSTDTHPQDGPEEMKKLAESKHFSFPYLYDKSQEIAHSYQAACTPDFYLFDASLKLFYRGRYDNSRPGNDMPVSGKELHQAADLMLSKRQMPEPQYPSMGCNIKWHSGNSPEDRF